MHKSRWIYSLLILSVISAILALLYGQFVFKSGTAGIGIIILLILYFKELRQSKDIIFIMLAFSFSIVGDYFLSNRNGDQTMFIIGIILFFIAHLGYFSYALFNGKINWNITILLIVAYLIFFLHQLSSGLNNTEIIISVIGYLLISCLSMGAALGIRTAMIIKLTYVIGIFLILTSDTIIALNEFCEYRVFNILILPTYYLAHILITFSLMVSYSLQNYKVR